MNIAQHFIRPLKFEREKKVHIIMLNDENICQLKTKINKNSFDCKNGIKIAFDKILTQ